MIADDYFDMNKAPVHCLVQGWTDKMSASGVAAWLEVIYKDGDWLILCDPDLSLEHGIRWAELPLEWKA